MKAQGWGRIIFMSSTTSREPDEDLVLSSVTRPGVTALAKTLSREVASLGITVNTILCGYADTGRLKSVLHEATRSGATYERALSKTAASVPMGRLGHPEEVSALAVFLASEKSSYLTGQAIAVDGGLLRGV